MDKATPTITYAQLDALLSKLSFVRTTFKRETPVTKQMQTCLRYEHAESDLVIILAEKKPTEMLRPADAWSARVHLILKGLITEKELEKYFGKSTPREKSASL